MRNICFAVILIAYASSAQAQSVCTLIVPEGVKWKPAEGQQRAEQQQSSGNKVLECQAGFVCELKPCEGWIEFESVDGANKIVTVVYRNNNNRSAIREVTAGQSFFLRDLNAGDSLTVAIGNLFRALRGDTAETASAGRFAIRPGASAGAVPAGQIAVFQGEMLAFSVADAAGAAYEFRPADAPGGARVVADATGVFRIDAAALPPGTRLRGGLEGGTEVSFQVAPEDKLARVAAELAAGEELSEAGARYRRALIFSDNGLAWNARQELAELGEAE